MSRRYSFLIPLVVPLLMVVYAMSDHPDPPRPPQLGWGEALYQALFWSVWMCAAAFWSGWLFHRNNRRQPPAPGSTLPPPPPRPGPARPPQSF